MEPGPKNNITDVEGIKVGHAHDKNLMSGTTVILPQSEAIAAVDSRGGGPGTRETDALNPENLVDMVQAVVLSGGSVMGLEAASGVASSLKKQGLGFRVAEDISVPVVPAAILFDLLNGGDKSLIQEHTYFNFGKKALSNADYDCPIGNVGAGLGAVAGKLKGGVGTASLTLGNNGFTVGALAAVNSFGSLTLPGSLYFWAWPFERNSEFGGRGFPKKNEEKTKYSDYIEKNEFDLDFDFESPFEEGKKVQKINEPIKKKYFKNNIPTNTTLCVVATDALLTKSQAKRVAIMAQDGIARAIRPVHTPFDGDTVFVLSTGKIPLSKNHPMDIAKLGMMASDCVSRSIVRGVVAAESCGNLKSYREILKNN